MRRGWFIIPGVQTGDRTIEQQVKGLEDIDFAGKTVLELGCSEGLMSKWMMERGAASVFGVDIVADHVWEARRQCRGLACRFDVVDIDAWRPKEHYDVVMALAVLHKLKRPDLAAQKLAAACRGVMVIRLPPETAPIVVDARSGNVPYDIGGVMERSGMYLTRTTRGSFDEWTGHYVRTP